MLLRVGLKRERERESQSGRYKERQRNKRREMMRRGTDIEGWVERGRA